MTGRLPWPLGPSPSGEGQLPRLERDAGKVYFIDEAAERWRVHDTIFHHGRHSRVRLGDGRAQYRVFVSSADVRRAYQFEKGELHDLAENHLVRQLREAGYLGTGEHRPPADPR